MYFHVATHKQKWIWKWILGSRTKWNSDSCILRNFAFVMGGSSKEVGDALWDGVGKSLLCLTGSSETSAIAQPPFDFFLPLVSSSLSHLKTEIAMHWPVYMSFSSHFPHSSEKKKTYLTQLPDTCFCWSLSLNVDSQDSTCGHMLNE